MGGDGTSRWMTGKQVIGVEQRDGSQVRAREEEVGA